MTEAQNLIAWLRNVNRMKTFNQRELVAVIKVLASNKRRDADELDSFADQIANTPTEAFANSPIQGNVTAILLKSLHISNNIGHVEHAIQIAGRLANND